MKPLLEISQILSAYLTPYLEQYPIRAHPLATLRVLEQCRTARLGGYIDACDDCGYMRISYNSCRNRHCPQCQTTNREKWILQREADLLPITYFHVVFTLPHCLNKLCLLYPHVLYSLLFKAAWQTVNSFALDQKGLATQTGMVAILHTWGQNLCLHPHLHCIVPGGGLSQSGRWKRAKSKGRYMDPMLTQRLLVLSC